MFLDLFIILAPIIGTFVLGGVAERVAAWRKADDRELQWIQSFVLAIFSTVLVFVVVPLGHAGISNAALEMGFGVFTWLHLPVVFASILGLLVLDMSEWAGHWSMHRIPMLWRLHAVHHSDDFLDTSTAFRFHPFEVLYRYCVVGLAVAVFAVPVQAIIAYALLVIGFNLWEHANVRTPLWTRKISSVFITPELHRLHHSDERRHYDSNFGVVFSVWDHLFGTLVPTDELTVKTSFGLGSNHNEKYKRLGQLFFTPFRKP